MAELQGSEAASSRPSADVGEPPAPFETGYCLVEVRAEGGATGAAATGTTEPRAVVEIDGPSARSGEKASS